MTILDSPLASLRRPRLLMSAARIGLGSYDRDAVLARLLGGDVPPPGRACVDILVEREADCERARRSGAAGYSIARHVDLLTALVAETRLYVDTRAVS